MRFGQYKFGKRISSGTFGVIYAGCDTHTGRAVAIKMASSKSSAAKQLQNEYKIYKSLKLAPEIYDIRTLPTGQMVMVMELLGASLDKQIKDGKRFTISQIGFIARNMIQEVKQLHEVGYIHRDIKPQNILWKQGNKRLHLIDYGLTMRWRHPRSEEPYEPEFDYPINGTMRYMSTYMHLGMRPSRRDDMISLFYTLLCVCGVHLPWRQTNTEDNKTQKRTDVIMRYKMGTPVEALCQEINRIQVRTSMYKFAKVIFSLRYNDEPPYDMLYKLFVGF